MPYLAVLCSYSPFEKHIMYSVIHFTVLQSDINNLTQSKGLSTCKVNSGAIQPSFYYIQAAFNTNPFATQTLWLT